MTKKKKTEKNVDTTGDTEVIEKEEEVEAQEPTRNYHAIHGELEDKLEELKEYFLGKIQEAAKPFQPRSRYPLTNDLQNDFMVQVGKITAGLVNLKMLPNRIPGAVAECEKKQVKTPELYQI